MNGHKTQDPLKILSLQNLAVFLLVLLLLLFLERSKDVSRSEGAIVIRAHYFQITKLAHDDIRENSISDGFLYANTTSPRQRDLNIHN